MCYWFRSFQRVFLLCSHMLFQKKWWHVVVEVNVFINHSKPSESREIQLPTLRSRYFAKQYLLNISQTSSKALFSHLCCVCNSETALWCRSVKYTVLSFSSRNCSHSESPNQSHASVEHGDKSVFTDLVHVISVTLSNSFPFPRGWHRETLGTSRVEGSLKKKRYPVPGWKEKVLMEHLESRHCVPPSLAAVSGYHSEVHSLSA